MKEKVIKEPVTKKKEERTYKTCLEMRNLFQLLKNTGLSVASLTSLVKLKTEIEQNSTEFYETQRALMEKHNVPKEKDQFILDSFSDEKKDLINKEREELLNTPVKLKQSFNFMTWKELHASTIDLSTDVIAIIAKWLVKDE